MCCLFYVQKALCSASYEEKETYKSLQLPASPLHVKNQTPQNHRKSPPHPAPKILMPQPCKETIHRTVRVDRPTPFRRVPSTKESFAKALKRMPEGEDSDRQLEENHWNVGPNCNGRKRSRQ